MDSTAKLLSSTSNGDYLKQGVVLLSAADLRVLVGSQVAIAAIDEAYAQLYVNRGDQGRSLGFSIAQGSIHVKAGLLPGSHECFAAKINVNLPGNGELNQLPTIQGVVVLVDAGNGRPLAILVSLALTAIRTAATAALAARHGARKNAKRLAIVGCGAQAGYQLDAFAECFDLEDVRVFDMNVPVPRRLREIINQVAGFVVLPPPAFEMRLKAWISASHARHRVRRCSPTIMSSRDALLPPWARTIRASKKSPPH